MEISRRSLLTSTAFGAGFLLVPGLRSAASAQTAKLVIGNYEAPGLYDQAAQEVVTDRDDGYHNDGNPRHYEWWYFDLFTQSGLKAAVILMDRPLIMLDFIASEEHCDVELGNNWCKGRYPNWQLHAEHDDVVVDLELVATVESWRAGSGAMYFDEALTVFNAHVVPAPRAVVNGTIQVAGETIAIEDGHGYHDHNWGNAGIEGVLKAWHWGRAECGDFTLNFSYIQHNADYGNKVVCKFMLAKDSEILLSTGEFEDSFVGEIHVGPQSGNGWPDGFLIEAPYNGDMIRIEISGNHLLSDALNSDQQPDDETARPGYIRLGGDIRVTVPLAGGVEVATGNIIHEMSFSESIPKAEANWLL